MEIAKYIKDTTNVAIKRTGLKTDSYKIYQNNCLIKTLSLEKKEELEKFQLFLLKQDFKKI